MEQPNVVPRINPFILSSDKMYLDFTASPGNSNKSVELGISMQRFLTFSLKLYFCLNLAVTDDWDDSSMFSFLDSKDKTAVVSKRMKYLSKHGECVRNVPC